MQTIEEKKELVWLPLELAKKVKDLTDAKAIENEILKYVADFKLSLRTDMEQVDEDIIRYKASMIKAKQMFREVCETEMADFENLWATHADDLARVKRKVEQVKEAISPIRSELQELKTNMNSIREWDVKGLLDVLEKVSYHINSNGPTGSILQFLFENYKKEE
jgi:phage shock protein A